MNLYLEKFSVFLKLEIQTDIFTIEFKGINFPKFGFLKKLDKLDLLTCEFFLLLRRKSTVRCLRYSGSSFSNNVESQNIVSEKLDTLDLKMGREPKSNSSLKKIVAYSYGFCTISKTQRV